MSKLKIWTLAVVGLLIPLALAMGAYLISSGIDASANSPPVTVDRQILQDARDSGTLEDDKRGPSPSTSATVDQGGRCAEPEHANDPSCTSGDGSSSGPGPGPSPSPSTTDSGGGSGSSGGSGGSGSSNDSGGSGGTGGSDDSGSSPNSGRGGGDDGSSSSR
jgi:hypothetical protein